MTTNLSFEGWLSVLGSEALTHAMLDGLMHHVHDLKMNGRSHRLAWLRGPDIGGALDVPAHGLYGGRSRTLDLDIVRLGLREIPPRADDCTGLEDWKSVASKLSACS